MMSIARTLVTACAMTVFLMASAPAPAFAESLSSAISSAKARNGQLAKGQWNFEAEKKFVAELDRVADSFHDSAAAGTSLTNSARSLIGLMETARKRYTDVLDSIQAEIIRIDGDLEAAQESERWQQHELLSMRVLYRLNWIRYESAMRFETNTTKRKTLLKQAAQGFEEFMGSDNASLTVEVLLGHGLASKAMRDYDAASADFTAALEIASDPEMIARLRIGLVEVYLTTKRSDQALAETQRLLAAKPRGQAKAQALFLRSKALLLALERQPEGSTRSNYVKECARHLEALYEYGAYWESKVVALVDAGNVNPDEWAAMSNSAFVSWLVADSLRRRDECDEALEVYKGLLDSERFRAEALYGSGSCSFHSGRYAEALAHLAKYVEENPEGVHLEQAAYLQFKGAESLYVSAEDNERDTAAVEYIRLLKEYLERAPEHEQVYEAWFRLGDWHREEREYIACAEAFEQVPDETLLSLKAAYLSAQCYVEAVLGVPEEDAPPPGLVDKAIASLDAFLAKARGPGDVPGTGVTASLESKATVMAASIVTKSETGSMQDRVDRLANFERDYGEDNDLIAEVLSLRIVAFRTLGDLDAAGVALERLLTLDGAEAYRKDSLKKLGIVFLKEAAERDERGDTDGAIRSRRVALRVYERLLEDTRSTASEREPQESVAGLEKLVDDLRAQVQGTPTP